MLPTAWSSFCQSVETTLVVDTVWGMLPMFAMKAATLPSTKNLKPKTPPSRTPTRISMMSIRLIIALTPLRPQLRGPRKTQLSGPLSEA